VNNGVFESIGYFLAHLFLAQIAPEEAKQMGRDGRGYLQLAH
jgi:hypothetical protein